MAVVGAEADAPGVVRRNHREQGGKVVCAGGLADKDVHAQPQLLQRFLDRHTFVVRADARSHVCVEVLARQPGCVAIQHTRPKRLDLVQGALVLVHHARVVHHLAQAQHPRVALQRGNVLRLEIRAGGRHVGGGDAGRHHHEHAQAAVLRLVEHVADTVQAQDVGDLVRIGDDRRDPARHHCRGELAHADHRALDVHVSVDQAGGQVAALQVDFLHARVPAADAGDAGVVNGDVGRIDLAGIDVHKLGITKDDIGRRLAVSDAHEITEFCHGLLLTQRHAIISHPLHGSPAPQSRFCASPCLAALCRPPPKTNTGSALECR